MNKLSWQNGSNGISAYVVLTGNPTFRSHSVTVGLTPHVAPKPRITQNEVWS